MKYIFRVYGEPMQYRAPGFKVIFKTLAPLLFEQLIRIVMSEPDKLPAAHRAQNVVNFFREKILKMSGALTVLTHPDSRVVKWQEQIKKQLIAHRTAQGDDFPTEPLTGSMQLDLWVFITRGKTVTKIYPDTRPDTSNYLKPAEDALNKLVIDDDGRFITIRVHKRYAYVNYPECGKPRKPGLIYVINTIEVNPEQKHRLNREYKEYLIAHNLEYRTIEVGRKKKRKTVLVEV
jgi:Holliday junction resolvase RusA-like endonuclease